MINLNPEEEALMNRVLENNDTVPENSPSLLIKDNDSRFRGAEWYDAVKQQTVSIVGIGGIGRFGNLIKF